MSERRACVDKIIQTKRVSDDREWFQHLPKLRSLSQRDFWVVKRSRYTVCDAGPVRRQIYGYISNLRRAVFMLFCWFTAGQVTSDFCATNPVRLLERTELEKSQRGRSIELI